MPTLAFCHSETVGVLKGCMGSGSAVIRCPLVDYQLSVISKMTFRIVSRVGDFVARLLSEKNPTKPGTSSEMELRVGLL